ncbi:MAG: hypothetical protein IH975_06305 [Nitrospinae bacterium]|nr:hypothetical protein [Nitrospinota bacterium]
MGFSSKGYWPAGIGLVALVGALVASLGILAWPPEAAEGKKLKLSCEEGRLLSLEARAALAPDLFRALERECGLILMGGENIPDRPVTATYEKVTLEEIIESLIRLAGLPNTLLAIASSGVLKVVVLATGKEIPRKAATPLRRAQPPPRPDSLFWVDEIEAEDAAIEKAQRRFLLAKTDDERDRAMEAMMRLDPDEAEDLQDLDEKALAEERLEAAVEEARRQFLLAKWSGERNLAMEAMMRLDPDEAEDLQDLDEKGLAEERLEAAVEDALNKFHLSGTDDERWRAYDELKRLDPDEAEDLLN